jgi:hypothetical protein
METEQSEGPLRNRLLSELYRRIGEPGTLSGAGRSMRFQLRANGGTCEAEGSLAYELPDKTLLRYNSDILFTLNIGKRVAVELKFLSSVSDQFKARSFNVMHVKKKHGSDVYCVLAYVHMSGIGISTDAAKSYCYPFDEFIGIDFKKPDDLTEAILNIAGHLETIIERMHDLQAATLTAG